MSGISEKQKMRDALQLTEGNLSSLIGIRWNAGMTEDGSADLRFLVGWRGVVRKALGHIVEGHECICPKCGIRHGTKHVRGDF